MKKESQAKGGLLALALAVLVMVSSVPVMALTLNIDKTIDSTVKVQPSVPTVSVTDQTAVDTEATLSAVALEGQAVAKIDVDKTEARSITSERETPEVERPEAERNQSLLERFEGLLNRFERLIERLERLLDNEDARPVIERPESQRPEIERERPVVEPQRPGVERERLENERPVIVRRVLVDNDVRIKEIRVFGERFGENRDRLVRELVRIRFHVLERFRMQADDKEPQHDPVRTMAELESLILRTGLTDEQKRTLLQGLKANDRTNDLLDEQSKTGNFVMWSNDYTLVTWGRIVPSHAVGVENSGEHVKYWYANGVFVGIRAQSDLVWGTYGDNGEKTFTLYDLEGTQAPVHGHYLVYNQH